jgi:hypothetical protein
MGMISDLLLPAGLSLDARLREQVWVRANACCEYCRFPAEFTGLSFHVHPIIPGERGGKAEPDNLALSCAVCHTAKGLNVSGVDPLSKQVASLFHPRKHSWRLHFRWEGPWLRPLTVVARVTVEVLEMNQAAVLELRKELMARGWSPDVAKPLVNLNLP